MEEMLQKVDGIELKVRQLALKLERIQNEHSLLQEENKRLKKELFSQRQLVGDMEQNLLKTQKALSKKREEDPEGSQKLRKAIDQYILEIDKCIEWLQNS